jgi:U1 small nuclear ribonucleoprotein 70kDa
LFTYWIILQDPKDTPPPTRVETKEERIERRRREKAEQVAYKLEREIANWDPNNINNATEDPFKTLFVARIVSLHLLN